MNSMVDQPGEPRDAARPAEQAGALDGDGIRREPQMREVWVSFRREMDASVRDALLDRRHSPPEIAYTVGEIVHNYFRTRGLTLTSYELRRLVAELLGPVRPAATLDPAPRPEAETSERAERRLVSFDEQSAHRAATGLADETPVAPSAAVSDAAFAPPPSKLVDVIDREAATFERLLAKVIEAARLVIGSTPAASRIPREQAFAVIDGAIRRVLQAENATLSEPERERLAVLAITEINGLGLIDRLWADHSVRAVLVDGPRNVYVERLDGTREPASETFRDVAHLDNVARRLAGLSSAGSRGIFEFQMRDGGSGTVIFPPSAPEGPVLVVRRGEPGLATFERLVESQLIDRRIAGLLRLAARARLNILFAGPEGSGKTALLSAIVRDQSAARVVTLSRHREFRWPSLAIVELVATAEPEAPSYAALLAAGSRLRPDLLVLDSLRIGDVPALAECLTRSRGTISAVGSDETAAALARAVDLVVRLGRPQAGLNRVTSLEDNAGVPFLKYEHGRYWHVATAGAFADALRRAGQGEALERLLR